MVLTFKRPWVSDAGRVAVPRAFSWLLLASIFALFAWAFLSNQQPSPYGSCYASRGHPIPCGPVTAKAVDTKALPVQRP